MKEPLDRVWFGSEEPIFDALPANVTTNFHNPRSENALLWNTVYRLAQPAIEFSTLLSVRPLWGTLAIDPRQDDLVPYYWGYDVNGARLDGLDVALAAVDGSGPRTEVDLFLVGLNNLIAVEAKHTGRFGTCSRFHQGRCPEIHQPGSAGEQACRYWEVPEAEFSSALRMGARPDPESAAPPCSRHYQLARTLLVGSELAAQRGLVFSLWVFAARTEWRSLESDWLDLCGRVLDGGLWRRMRVLAWEDLNFLG